MGGVCPYVSLLVEGSALPPRFTVLTPLPPYSLYNMPRTQVGCPASWGVGSGVGRVVLRGFMAARAGVRSPRLVGRDGCLMALWGACLRSPESGPGGAAGWGLGGWEDGWWCPR